MNNFRTGKLSPRIDSRTFQLAALLAAATALPTPPAALTYRDKVSPWGMYGNDKWGDCTCAAAAHMIELDAKLEGKRATPALRTIESAYHHLSPDDQGCVMLDVLNYWRKTGFGGHHLYAFAALDLKSTEHIKLSVLMFGGVYLGVALPQSAQAQTGPGMVWDVPTGGPHGQGAPGSWGGHAINVVGYDSAGLDVITWGQVQRMTWAFWNTYADEAWAVLPAEWAAAPKSSGIDYAALQAALSQIGKAA
jgi:hypothetical protein